MPEIEVLSSNGVRVAYSIAESCLAKISTYCPKKGSSITLEGIEKAVKSFNPIDWYDGKVHKGEILSFGLLSEEDQSKVLAAIKQLRESTSNQEIIAGCEECGNLVHYFDKKVCAR